MSSEPLSSFSTPYVITRQSAAGSYVRGIWKNAGSPITLTADMVVQPVTGYTLANLPEGERNKDMVRAYTDTLLVSANQKTQKKGDRFLFRGRVYEVTRQDDWDQSILSHFKFFAALVEEDI